MLDTVRTGRLRISAENIESVRQAFSRFPMKSIRTAVTQLELPPTTVHKVLHRRLTKCKCCRDFNKMTSRNEKFADNMLHRISEDKEFLKRICFSDEATFHVFGKLNKHNVRIWGSEHPHEIRELERNSPKVNV